MELINYSKETIPNKSIGVLGVDGGVMYVGGDVNDEPIVVYC